MPLYTIALTRPKQKTRGPVYFYSHSALELADAGALELDAAVGDPQ